jgi:hypothetical protein
MLGTGEVPGQVGGGYGGDGGGTGGVQGAEALARRGDVAGLIGSCCRPAPGLFPSRGPPPLASRRRRVIVLQQALAEALPVRHSCVRTGDDEARPRFRLSSPHSTLRIDHSPRPPSPHPCSDSECEPKKQPPTRLVRPILSQARRAAGEPRLSASSLCCEFAAVLIR